MESIEQLRQDNVKLTERLNNAAKFFREQKAQIEALTKENENLKITNENLTATIQSKEKAHELLQNTYNEVFAEKEKITKQYKEQEKFETEVINVKVPELEERLKNTEKAYKELQSKYKENDEYRKSIDILQNTIKTYERKIDELENNNPEVQNLEEQLVNAEKAYKELRDKYKANDIAKGEAELKVENLQNEYTKKFEVQDKEIKELTEAGIDYVNQINTLKKKLAEDTKTLQDKYDNLEKIYNDLENQKLAADADYQGVLDMYQELQKEYERLRNERDIYSQSDDALAEITKILIEKGFVNKNDLTPQTGIKESGTAHRMGDNLESGKNVGV